MRRKAVIALALIALILPIAQLTPVNAQEGEGGPYLVAVIWQEEPLQVIGIQLADFDGNGRYARTRHLELMTLVVIWEGEDGNLYMLAGSNYAYTLDEETGVITITGDLEDTLPKGMYLLRVRERGPYAGVLSYMRFRDTFATARARIKALCNNEDGSTKYLYLYLTIRGRVLRIIEEGREPGALKNPSQLINTLSKPNPLQEFQLQLTDEVKSFRMRFRVRSHDFVNGINGLEWTVYTTGWID